MAISLRILCAAAPQCIRRPPAGSSLLAICETDDRASWPKDFEGFTEAARRIVDSRPRPAGLPPFYRELVYVSDVQRYTIYLNRLRRRQQEKIGDPDRHQGLAVFIVIGTFLDCGGRLGPGDHGKAHVRASELLGPGIAPEDIASLVSVYTAATSQLMHDNAYRGWGEQLAEEWSACVSVARDLLTEHHNLLDHSHDDARQAAEEAAYFDARYPAPRDADA